VEHRQYPRRLAAIYCRFEKAILAGTLTAIVGLVLHHVYAHSKPFSARSSAIHACITNDACLLLFVHIPVMEQLVVLISLSFLAEHQPSTEGKRGEGEQGILHLVSSHSTVAAFLGVFSCRRVIAFLL